MNIIDVSPRHLDEAEVFDDRGNMLLGKDLKVHHKESGLEYTVDDVFADPESAQLKIALRLPDEPRVEPPGEEGVIADNPRSDIIGEDEVITPGTLPGDLALVTKQAVPEPVSGVPDADEEIFIIDQEEFEKEYEVK